MMRLTAQRATQIATMSYVFNVGDHVRWPGPNNPGDKDEIGTIIDISPSDSGNPELVVFEVLFEFDLWHLFADQLERAVH
jgi:hypothetical protein